MLDDELHCISHTLQIDISAWTSWLKSRLEKYIEVHGLDWHRYLFMSLVSKHVRWHQTNSLCMLVLFLDDGSITLFCFLWCLKRENGWRWDPWVDSWFDDIRSVWMGLVKYHIIYYCLLLLEIGDIRLIIQIYQCNIYKSLNPFLYVCIINQS